MAERELAILIRAKDLASKSIGSVQKKLGGLEATGRKAMSGLTTALTRVGVAAGVTLVGALALGVRSLGDLQRTMNQTDAVITSTGGAAGVTAKEVRDLAQALEGVTTVDDKVIQDGQNMLLTFTGIGKKVFPQATEATLNLALAMAKGDASNVDMKASAIQVGKALQDPIKGVTALRKVGVAFTDQQRDQIKALVKSGDTLGAQKIILAELAKEFGKAGEAAGTGFEADMRRVQDAGEDATQALAKGFMPVLARAASWLSKKLADPAVLKAIEELGQGLADMADGALSFVEQNWDTITSAFKTVKDTAGAIVSIFMGLPDWVKTAIVTGWGLNKLTGGALSGVVSGLAGGLIKGVLGMNAGVVNINAAMVNGGGGIPGGPAAAGGGLLAAALPWAVIGASIAAPIIAALKISADNSGIAQGVRETAEVYIKQNPTTAQLQSSLNAVDQGINDIQANPLNVLVSGDALEQLRATRVAIQTKLDAQRAATHDAATRVKDDITAAGMRQIAATNAVRDKVEGTRIATKSASDIASGKLSSLRDKIEGTRIAAASAGIKAAAASDRAATAIRNKDLSVSVKAYVNTSVSVRSVIGARTLYGQYQKTSATTRSQF